MNPALKFPWKVTLREAGLIAWSAAQLLEKTRDHGPEAAARFREHKARSQLAQHFSSAAEAHLRCRKSQCRRARRCARWTLDCVEAFGPVTEEEAQQRYTWQARFVTFAFEHARGAAPPDSSKG